MRALCAAVMMLGLAACKTAAPAPTPAPPVDPMVQLRQDAAAATPLVKTPLALRFIEMTPRLPDVKPRQLFRSKDHKRYFTEREAAALPDAERAALEPFPVDGELYHFTGYGSALSYARPLDLLGEQGVQPDAGLRWLDFGYGTADQLRMLAELGMDVTGVDVDPMLRAIYAEPGDQGAIGKGQLHLLSGRFPADPEIATAVGTGYDVIVSKNVLKRGYIHPDRPADERKLIKLGVDDDVFLKAIAGALKPGGRFLIYNVCPALTPADKPFVPWSDGRSPFTAAQFEAAGLHVVVLDRDDTAFFRVMGHALTWDVGDDAMDLQNDLSVIYTLVERPR